MITRDSLKDHFDELGIEVTDEVLDKCVEICVIHNVDEETFVETWMAYSITHCNGETPTLSKIIAMERQEFAKHDIGTNNTTSKQSTTPSRVYNNSPSSKSNNTEYNINVTPKNRGDRRSIHKNDIIARSPRNIFSPASYSPSAATPSSKYSNRTNAGQTLCEFGQGSSEHWKAESSVSVTIAPYNDGPYTTLPHSMFEPYSNKAAILKEAIERLGYKLVEAHRLAKPLLFVGQNLTECVCIGRIRSDTLGHLSDKSILFELPTGVNVTLDMFKIQRYTLFPGQILAIEGSNPSTYKVVVDKMYCSSALPPPPFAPQFVQGPMQLVIACGPFTLSDNLAYQPLEDLMKRIVSEKPHVVVLIGPLISSSHPLVAEGAVAENFDEMYDKIIKGIMEPLKGSWTKVVIVSSSQDCTSNSFYPTPPPPSYKHNYANLTLVSDPSIINISGLVVGLTATDSLMHLSKEEVSFPAGGSDRLGRLASHILEQQNFYPLYPPNEDVAINSDLWDTHAILPATPHLLIVPSDLRYFVKLIHECVVVNPERMAKGQIGGSFVRIKVDPETDGIWSPKTHISAQILKI